jgi:hypothetical protein
VWIKSWKHLMLGSSLVLFVACGDKGGDGAIPAGDARLGVDSTPVVARIGDVELTQAYFDYRYEALGPQEKARFSGENWKARFLDYLIDETLLYKQAESERFDRYPDVERQLDLVRRSILVSAYRGKKFSDQIAPSEEQIAAHYEQNKGLYMKAGKVYGYHIRNSDKSKVDAAYKELQDGKRFAEVAVKYSDEPVSREKGGEVGWFNPDGYVLGVGYNKQFTDLAFALPANGTSSPTRIGDSWHIVRIGPKDETSAQPLAQARETIERTLKPILVEEAFTRHLKELRSTSSIERFGEYQELEIRTPEQLYQLASESRNPHAKKDYYQTLADKYPEHQYADDALFMAGFIHSEEFNQVMEASVAFRRLLAEYPQSEFADQAVWMLNNLGTGAPEWRGQNAPQSPAEAAERIDQMKG